MTPAKRAPASAFVLSDHPALARALLPGILLIAVVIRLPGLTWGMPQYVAPNEAEIMAVAVGIFKGDLNPHNWWWGSLYMYVNAAIVALTHATRIGASALHLTNAAYTPYWWFFVASRLANVGFSVLSIYALYRIGNLLGGRKLAIGAAGFCAVMPAHFSLTPEMKPDVLMLMVLTVESLFALHAYVKSERRAAWLLAAAFFSGLALGTKYVFVAPLTWICAEWLIDRRDGTRFFGRRLIAAGLCAAAGFIVACPFAIIVPQEFLHGVLFQNSEYSGGHPGADSMPTGIFFVKYLFTQGFTPLLFFAAVAGAALMVRRGNGGGLAIIAVAPLAWAGVLSAYTINFAHHTAPLGIPASVAAAWLLVNTRGRVSMSVLTIATLALPVVAAAQSMRVRSRADIRITAGEWINRNLPAGCSVAREEYTPFVGGRKIRSSYIGICGSAYFDADSARRAGYDYLITADHQRFFSRPDRYAREIRNYEDQLKQFTCIKRFEPDKHCRGPEIVVLKVK